MVAAARHRQERLRHEFGTQLHLRKGEIVPGNHRVDVTAHTQAEDGLTTPFVKAARDQPRPVSRYRRLPWVRKHSFL